jgi:hypothetical protein
VRIERERFRELKQRFAALAVPRSVEDLCDAFRRIEFEPYAPVRDQLRLLLRAVNRRRQAANLEVVPPAGLRLRRTVIRPFA